MTRAMMIVALLALPSAARATPRESVGLAAVDSNGLQGAASNSVRSFSLAGGYSLGRIDVAGTLTAVSPATWRTDSRILLTAPSGHTAVVQPFESGTTFSSLGVSASFFMPDGTLPAGSWTARFFEAIDDGGSMQVDARWDLTLTFTDEPPTPPGSQTLGPILPGGTTVSATHAAGQVRWYTFDLARPITGAGGSFLDIHTTGSLIAANGINGEFPDDTEIGLYGPGGALIAADDDSGDGTTSLLTFGGGMRPPVGPLGDGSPFDGHHGSLQAGTYYLAAAIHNTTFAPTLWGASSTATRTGTIQITIRGQLPPACAPDFNGDGNLDPDDLSDFITCFFTNAIFPGSCPEADYNDDGNADPDDLSDYITAFFSGC